MAYLNINIPPVECFVRGNFLQNRPKWEDTDKYFPCVIFGMSSIPNRVPLFHFLMEDEGIWWRMPIQAFCSKEGTPQEELYNLVLWDCFSYYPSVTIFELLANKPIRYLDRNKKWNTGKYLFTIDWAHEDKTVPNTGWSEVPGQHKCGHFIQLDNGNYAIQPNNRCRLFEPSFVTKPGQNVIERKLNTNLWTVEDTAKWVLSDDDRYDYEVKEKNNV